MRGPPGSVRIVLLIRFWHPDIDPKQYSKLQLHMQTTYKEHKRNVRLPPLKRAKEKGLPLIAS
jgi:hypothetical protein